MKAFYQVKLWLEQLQRFFGSLPSATSHPACFRPRRRRRSLSVVLLAIVLLTVAFGHRYYNVPKLAVGTRSPLTIAAPRAALVEDPETTAFRREAARNAAGPMLMMDAQVNQQIQQELKQYLDHAQSQRQIAGNLPFVEPDTLSTPSQIYLRQVNLTEWQQILAASQPVASTPSPSPPTTTASQLVITQLQTYRQAQPPQVWQQLLKRLTQARTNYQKALALPHPPTTPLETPRSAAPTLAPQAESSPSEAVVPAVQLPPSIDWAQLLNLSEQDWKIFQVQVPQILQKMLAQGIPLGLPSHLRQQAIAAHLTAMPVQVKMPATSLLMAVLKPNLIIDPVATERQKEAQAATVPTAMLAVKAKDVIVYGGERINPQDFILLDYFGLSRRGIDWWGLVGTAALISASVAVVWQVQKQVEPPLARRDYLLLLLLATSAPLMTWFAGLRYTSLVAVGLLIGSFYGSTLAITVVGLLTLLMPLLVLDRLVEILLLGVGSATAGSLAGRLRSREEFAFLGGGIALVEGVIYFLILTVTRDIIWYKALSAAALWSVVQLGWSVVALGLSPYLEHLFDLVTPIRLAELANPNRPLLKRLAQEAPGTFQHTLFVATLAEAGAQALGGNAELVRTGTLYHDIGKLHDPMSFIENQMGGPNRHDEIQDPWVSLDIIRRHVSEGQILARKHRLPTSIQAFIPEHQGTTLIAFFYHQAQQRSLEFPDRSVQEQDFRYVGPTPQSRETGIVMLADSCEAALRSLKEATFEEALNMVNKIFRARWQEQQLIDSGLSRQELATLANVFVQVWVQHNHKRIRYPTPVNT
jgi:cyclic-di-AMP phosphodiesterase PgpH